MTWQRVALCMLAALLILTAEACFSPQRPSPAAGLGAEEALSVIPAPREVHRLNGTFTLDGGTRILIDRGFADAKPVAEYLADFLSRATGRAIPVYQRALPLHPKGAIRLVLGATPRESGEEAYELQVRADRVIIRASTATGLFYGAQTLRQLLPPEIEGLTTAPKPAAWQVPCVRILDGPRFRWRGLLLDCARHFFPKESVKRFIDLMALHKFNVLQIHFTDDQSWTLQIDAYPNLTKIGAHGGPYAMNGTWLGLGKGIGSGRFFTRDDVREMVRYAADRHITIVPEIEMPAHAGSWLASCPELLCTSGQNLPAPAVGTHGEGDQRAVWAAHRELCPGNEATYQMAERILAEVFEMFPGGHVHLGGDEASKYGWKLCQRCQARMKAEGLKDERELQSYFIRRIGKFIESRGRDFVGWDEIMQGGLAPNAIVMSWTGVAPDRAAVRAGHNVIFSPTSHCYFDYPYDRISTQKVHSFDPVETLTDDEAKHVMGIQGNLWTESIPDMNRLEYMAFPRATALAEVAWSPGGQRNWADFQKRLAVHLRRLDRLRVNYNRENGR